MFQNIFGYFSALQSFLSIFEMWNLAYEWQSYFAWDEEIYLRRLTSMVSHEMENKYEYYNDIPNRFISDVL